MATGFTAIEQFKKLPPEEKKKTAIKFFGFYDGPNRVYIDDDDNFDADGGALSDSGIEDWVEFLQGEDPFYFSDPPQSVQQEVMRKFDQFLYKEFREFESLKKGYEKPIALLTANEIVNVMRGLRKYQNAVRGISEEVLPAVEDVVKEELGDAPVQFNMLSRALTGVGENIDNAIRELTFYFTAAKEAEKTGNAGTKRRVIAHFEQYHRELIQLAKKTMVVNKHLGSFKSKLPKKIKEMIKTDNFNEENMNSFIKAYEYLQEEIPNYIPIYGSVKMYDSSQPWDSQQNTAALASLGIDAGFLAIAIKTAMMIPGGTAVKIAWATAQFIVTDTAIGAAVGPFIMRGIDDLAHIVWPELDRLEQVEQRGFAK